MDWRWQLFGLDIGRYRAPNNDRLYFWHVSYSSIVVPLVLLSSWLFLSKPRSSRANKSAGYRPHPGGRWLD
jgi:hypothetical protein